MVLPGARLLVGCLLAVAAQGEAPLAPDRPTVPKQAPVPLTLIHSHETMKLRIFTNLNKRRVRTIPKKMTIPVSTTTEPTRDKLSTHPPQKKAIPDPTNHNNTQKRLISIPNMRRSKELVRATNIQKRASPKTTPCTEISRNLAPPSRKNGRSEVLNTTSQVTQAR